MEIDWAIMHRPLLALALGGLLFTGCKSESGTSSDNKIPTTAFGGGAALQARLELNQKGHVSLELYGDEEQTKTLGGHQVLKPGAYVIKTDVGGTPRGMFELSIRDAKPGAKVSWEISLDGKVLHKESEELKAPLKKGRGFFLQYCFPAGYECY
jgi:hypothetical protein